MGWWHWFGFSDRLSFKVIFWPWKTDWAALHRLSEKQYQTELQPMSSPINLPSLVKTLPITAVKNKRKIFSNLWPSHNIRTLPFCKKAAIGNPIRNVPLTIASPIYKWSSSSLEQTLDTKIGRFWSLPPLILIPSFPSDVRRSLTVRN